MGSSTAPTAGRLFARPIGSVLGRRSCWRLIRFGVVGLVSNGLLRLASAGLDAVAAAMLVYGIGVLSTYPLNRKWTFGPNARHRTALAFYPMVHGFGAALTAAILFVFNHRLGYSAVLVGCGAAVAAALSTFGLLHVVFSRRFQTHEASTAVR